MIRFKKFLATVFAAASAAAVVAPLAAFAAPPATPEFQLEAATNPNKAGASVATDSAGNLISVYTVPNGDLNGLAVKVYVVRHSAARVQLGNAILIDDNAFSDSPSVAADAAGNFTVLWTRFDNSPVRYTTIRAQRFDSSGAPRGAAFSVTSPLVAGTRAPTIAMNASGEALITWYYFTDTQIGVGFASFDVGNHALHARRYAANGLPRGGEIVVRNIPFSTRNNALVQGGDISDFDAAINDSGAFAFAWNETVRSGNGYARAIMERRYGADNRPIDGGVVVESSPPPEPGRTLIANANIGIDAAGNTLVAWTDSGVVARRYDSNGVASGAKFVVSASADNSFVGAQVIMNPSGEALIGWRAIRAIPGEISIYGNYQAQRIDASGAKSGTAFTVNTATRDDITFVDGTPDGRGGYVLTWILSTNVNNSSFTWSSNGNLYAARCCTQP